MGLFDITPQLAPMRNAGNEGRKMLEAQVSLAPKLFEANQIYQPLYGSLNLQNIDQFLNGTPEADYDTYDWQKAKYRGGGDSGDGLFGDLFNLSPGSPGNFDLFGGGGDGKQLIRPAGFVKSGTAHRAAQRGFLDIYQNDIIPAMSRAQSQQREADISDVAKLGPQERAALRIANPDAAALLDQLFAQSQGDLAAGAALTPAQARLLQQSVRSGQASRGMGFGNGDLFQEAFNTLDYGRGLQNERRAFAGNTLGQLEHFYGDPFQAILGRSSQAAAQAQSFGNSAEAQAKQGSQFDPFSAYGSDLFNTNFNAMQSRNNAAASNNAAILGGIISSVGSMAGGAAGAAI